MNRYLKELIERYVKELDNHNRGYDKDRKGRDFRNGLKYQLKLVIADLKMLEQELSKDA